MSKSKATIIIILLILLIAGGLYAFYYFYLNPNNTPTLTSPTPSIQATITPQTSITPTQTSQSPTPSSTIATSTPIISNGATTTVSIVPPLPILRQISKEPVAGAITFDKNVGTKKKPLTQTIIRYIDKVTGHIHETRTDTLDTQEISTTRIPKIFDAVWNASGNSLYIRYLNDLSESIQTFYGQLKALPPPIINPRTLNSLNPPSAIVYAQQELQGVFLDQDIKSLNVNKNNIFYLLTGDNLARGILAANDGSHRVEIFNSPISEWQTTWPKDNIIAFTTKPSYFTQGYLYFLNTSSLSFTKVMGGQYGLTTLASPDVNSVFYSESNNGILSSSVYSIKNSQTLGLSVATLPEKCVWSKKNSTIIYCGIPQSLSSANYPDDWYQGLISFNDNIEKIDTKTGVASTIAVPSFLVNIDMDIIKPFLTDKEDFLFFINKKDGMLWSLKLQ
jgi:hypothetical protein